MASKPKTFKKLMVQKLTSNFREAVSIETVNMCHPKKGEVCVKNKYVGINATDVNFTKGRYFVNVEVPFGVGFEGVGEIVEIGENVENFKIGQSVAYLDGRCNAYAEYVVSMKQRIVSLLLSSVLHIYSNRIALLYSTVSSSRYVQE
ncbi:hypothetical protein AVEN_43933-1 [Araneus ventricosus]|uniref:Alcohol dehydrogenase-like N-terminal domain-containing protein n=1 Tax=Araneus ventricosus TaxID=182803 RepID=A0A4Y2WQS4_ARAVE|nr:hypothetical protein AVEN_43933-1 [Araneus ventricosus]